MSYFAPYLDDDGMHLPTYDDRMEDMLEAYRTIFGEDAVLTPDTMDYQLLSLFAKALDDMCSLLLDVYVSRDPDMARGQALDLLLPLTGLRRETGETDEALRDRRAALAALSSVTTAAGIEAAVRAVPGVTRVKVFVNDADAANGDLPAHSVTVLAEGGNNADVAKAILAKKAPGIPTAGATSVTVPDLYGVNTTVRFSRPETCAATCRVVVQRLTGWTDGTADVIKNAAAEYVSGLDIGEPLIVPVLYGAIYEAVGAVTFTVTGITVSGCGQSSSTQITPGYRQRLNVLPAYVQVVEN
ncbi:MAG: hypothetical protein Q4G19_02775 [Clostridia bacterium]|nr:hypothetical protein [Clostridia bacterium]